MFCLQPPATTSFSNGIRSTDIIPHFDLGFYYWFRTHSNQLDSPKRKVDSVIRVLLWVNGKKMTKTIPRLSFPLTKRRAIRNNRGEMDECICAHGAKLTTGFCFTFRIHFIYEHIYSHSIRIYRKSQLSEH